VHSAPGPLRVVMGVGTAPAATVTRPPPRERASRSRYWMGQSPRPVR
jgi:hypothetical protein